MKKIKNLFNRIGFKLILTVELAVIIIIGIYAYFNIDAQSRALLQEAERHANQLSETVKAGTRYDMLLNQRDRIHKIIERIGENETIKDVRVLNKVGEIIYSSDSSSIGRMVDKYAESCYVCHAENEPLERLSIKERTRIFRLNPDSSRIMGIINPIYTEKSCYEAECHAHPEDQTVLGVLDVTMSLEEIDSQITQSKFNILLFTIISIIAITLIIWIFVRKWISKPVSDLVNATNHVALGNLSYKIERKRKDELGSLADSFNNMTKKLSEMRMQLFQSDKMASLGRLAAGVAHEINNPLTGVLTYSSFLLKRSAEHPEWQEDLNVIVRETKRSRDIVKGLLDFARQSTPTKHKININDVIERSVVVVQNQLKIHKVQLEKNLQIDIPEITADANQMQQVFINLLVNAFDAIGEKNGTINISTSQISLSPIGITQIKQAVCPKNHNLMDDEHKIDGSPSIKLKVLSNGKEGIIYFDPVYGRNHHNYEIAQSKGENYEVQCPVCGISMMDPSKECKDCSAPVYNIIVPQKGVLEACAKFGCEQQKWDFMDEAGDRKFVQIKFSDNGSGIPDENLGKIFDPFFSTKGQKGTGLGLSVIWGIVDNHNGKISVDSKLGEGTTFIIRLPIN